MYWYWAWFSRTKKRISFEPSHLKYFFAIILCFVFQGKSVKRFLLYPWKYLYKKEPYTFPYIVTSSQYLQRNRTLYLSILNWTFRPSFLHRRRRHESQEYNMKIWKRNLLPTFREQCISNASSSKPINSSIFCFQIICIILIPCSTQTLCLFKIVRWHLDIDIS